MFEKNKVVFVEMLSVCKCVASFCQCFSLVWLHEVLGFGLNHSALEDAPLLYERTFFSLVSLVFFFNKIKAVVFWSITPCFYRSETPREDAAPAPPWYTRMTENGQDFELGTSPSVPNPGCDHRTAPPIPFTLEPSLWALLSSRTHIPWASEQSSITELLDLTGEPCFLEVFALSFGHWPSKHTRIEHTTSKLLARLHVFLLLNSSESTFWVLD